MKPGGIKNLISKPLATFWLVCLVMALGLQFSDSFFAKEKKVNAGDQTDTELVITTAGTSHSAPALPEIKISEPWTPALAPVWSFGIFLKTYPGFAFHPLQKWELKRLLMSTISINAP